MAMTAERKQALTTAGLMAPAALWMLVFLVLPFIAIIVFAVAAAEVAVGLALVISVYRRRNTVIADELDMLKW